MLVDSHFHASALPPHWFPMTASTGLSVSVNYLDYVVNHSRVQTWSGDWRLAIGVHPWYVEHAGDVVSIRQALEANADLMVGEIGLDGSERWQSTWNHQLPLFDSMLTMAVEFNRAMSLHVVNDRSYCYEMVKSHPKARGVVHGFAGSLEQCLLWQSLGFYIGVGLRSLQNPSKKTIRWLSGLDRQLVLLETDAPFFFSSTKELMLPDDIVKVIEMVSTVWNMPVTYVETLNYDNWMRFCKEAI